MPATGMGRQGQRAARRPIRSARILLAGQSALGAISVLWMTVLGNPELELLRWSALQSSVPSTGGAVRYSMLGASAVGSREVLALIVVLTPFVLVVVPFVLAILLGTRRPWARWLTVGVEALLVVMAARAFIGPLPASSLLGLAVIVQLARPATAGYFNRVAAW